MVRNCQWTIATYQFHQDLKVLPLHSYDPIQGMDWLEHFSPMQTHWRLKWITIPYNGLPVTLHDKHSPQEDELLIQLISLQPLDQPLADSVHCSNDIQLLLKEFPLVCSVPSELPPVRSCDHTIPLVQGAQPVNIRPYRYPPALKDEIESQVAQMFQQGLIQPSMSSFASPVLLVKKKGGTWRFCVDYRYLNELTVNSWFPIPVFDQLMDELTNAKWFSILDLYAGYHPSSHISNN